MALPNEQTEYALSVEDILGDEIAWYECILSAIHRAVPEISDTGND